MSTLPISKPVEETCTTRYPRPEQRELFIGNHRISPPIILAPMAAVTHYPYRQLCREMGAGMVVTEMVYSRLLVQKPGKARELLDITNDESPVSVQLYGKDPSEFAEAAQLCEAAGADVIDVNMGCPMRKVVSSGHGASLLKDPQLIKAIITEITKSVSIPVTAKIRVGWSEVNAIQIAETLEEAGAAAIAVHGRTREEGYEGSADLSVIASIKNAISIPVIGNGDIIDATTARRMFHETGCDGIMIARGCLGNPWIFAECAADLRGDIVDSFCKPGTNGRWTSQSINEFRRVVSRHLDLTLHNFGLSYTSRAFRKQLIWYFKGTPASAFVQQSIRSIETEDEIKQLIDAALARCEHNTDAETVQISRT